jgi:hypothetical protein
MERVMGLVARLDGEFLVLSGSKDEYFIYGRVDNQYANAAPSLPQGVWQGEVARGQTADAELSMQGQKLTIEYGPHDSKFNGSFTRGYFVGPVTSVTGGGSGFAILAPAGDGRLDGMVSLTPFNEMRSEFNFTHGS